MSQRTVREVLVLCPQCEQGSSWDAPLLDYLPAGYCITCRQCGHRGLAISWSATGALVAMREEEAVQSVPAVDDIRCKQCNEPHDRWDLEYCPACIEARVGSFARPPAEVSP